METVAAQPPMFARTAMAKPFIGMNMNISPSTSSSATYTSAASVIGGG